QVQFTDVQTAGGHIGRNQHTLATLLESLDGQLALLLILLPVQYIHPQPLYRAQHAIESVSHDPGVGEHDGLALALVEQQPPGELFPVGVVIHRNHLLTNRRGIGLHAVQFEPARLIQDLLDHATDALIAGGAGEQHGLTLLGAGAGDTQYIFAEAHVQHTVSFVDNQGLNFGQVQPAGFQLLQGTTGGGNDDIRVLAQLGGLHLEVLPADDQLSPEEGETRQRLNVLENLLRQLAGGRQHQSPWGQGLAVVLQQPLQDRQHIGGGLAAAGLGNDEQVFAGNGGRNGRIMNGGRLLEEQFGQSIEKTLVQG